MCCSMLSCLKVCVCRHHENVRLLLMALSKHTSLPKSTDSIATQLTCSDQNEDCIWGRCLECKDRFEEFSPNEEDGSRPVKWYQWKKLPGLFWDKALTEDTIITAYESLGEQIRPFLIHQFVKRRQAARFEAEKDNVNGERIVFQVDFAENFSVELQNEIQSRHWENPQVSLFTGFSWLDKNTTKSFGFVSDVPEHSKVTAALCIERMLLSIKSENLKHLTVFSDGAASQFKSKFMMNHMSTWQEKLGISIDWVFFATSHGKGVVDGIGGTLKSIAHRLNKAEVSEPTGNIVNSAASFIATVQPRTRIHLQEYGVRDVQAMQDVFDSYGEVSPCPGIQSQHVFGFRSGTMSTQNVAEPTLAEPMAGTVSTCSNLQECPSHAPKVGALVAVAYDQGWYVGEVQAATEGKVVIKFLEAGKRHYRWTDRSELIPVEFVMSVVPLLSPCDSSCRAYRVENFDDIQSAYDLLVLLLDTSFHCGFSMLAATCLNLLS